MECGICGKVVESTKKNILKEIIYKKGKTVVWHTNPTVCHEGGFLGIGSKEYTKWTITKYKVLKDVLRTYFRCPVCGYKDVLGETPYPNEFDKKIWKVISKEKTVRV